MDTGQKQEQGPPSAKSAPPANEKRSFWQRAPVIIVGTFLRGVLVFVGLRYLADGWTHESTDDAFLDTHIVTVAPRVAGQIQRVEVKDNQLLHSGDLIVELDPRDLPAAQEQKRAAVNAARANVELLRASLELSKAQVTSAEAAAKQSAAIKRRD